MDIIATSNPTVFIKDGELFVLEQTGPINFVLKPFPYTDQKLCQK
jgi:hypothetical protein